MNEGQQRRALLEFLEERVFLPALNADPALFSSPEDRRLLESGKKRVQATRMRYHEQYETAAAVKSNLLQDLNSKFGQDLAADMWVLKLQRFEDIRQEFLALCATLGF